jgi:hypothetical protein
MTDEANANKEQSMAEPFLTLLRRHPVGSVPSRPDTRNA